MILQCNLTGLFSVLLLLSDRLTEHMYSTCSTPRFGMSGLRSLRMRRKALFGSGLEILVKIRALRKPQSGDQSIYW